MAEYSTEQNFRLAQKMLEQQGEINALKAERDALKAALARTRTTWSEWYGRLGGAFPPAMVQEMDAALDAPTESTDHAHDHASSHGGEHGAAKMRPVSVESPGNDGFRYVLSAPESPCPRCEGSMIEPGSEDYDPAVHMHNPTTGEPCAACNGTGKATGWLDQLAAMSLRAAKAKFGPDGSELCRCGNPDDCSCAPESPQEETDA